MIDIEVCYVSSENTLILRLNMISGSAIINAIEDSQILHTCPEIDISQCKLGIFGKIKFLNTVLQQGDRVEIYRPLIADPMEARRRRAAKKLQM
ncbi:MAG: RnfH family protein [Cytophaga sp.]|nr:RnfH family protein [Undibacterium sp.]